MDNNIIIAIIAVIAGAIIALVRNRQLRAELHTFAQGQGMDIRNNFFRWELTNDRWQITIWRQKQNKFISFKTAYYGEAFTAKKATIFSRGQDVSTTTTNPQIVERLQSQAAAIKEHRIKIQAKGESITYHLVTRKQITAELLGSYATQIERIHNALMGKKPLANDSTKL